MMDDGMGYSLIYPRESVAVAVAVAVFALPLLGPHKAV